MNDKKKALKKKSRTSRKKTDKLFADEIKILMKSATDLKDLRPRITDKATYDKLIKEVSEATWQNESLAMLQKRIEKLGSTGIGVLKEVIKLLT